MPLGLHKNILDFEILETGNTKTLVFVDSSQYDGVPDRPLLEVIMPGYTKYFLVNVAANQVNTFNSSTIGFNKVLLQSELVDLPDGVWSFKYKICPYNYVYVIKHTMRVTQLLKKVEKILNQVDLGECSTKDDEELQKSFSRIYILIEGARAAAKAGDTNKAYNYYQLADKLAQKQLDKFCKNC